MPIPIRDRGASRGYGARVAQMHLVAMPRLRLACRLLDDGGVDPDLVLAEAGAVIAWAAQHGRTGMPWRVVDGERVAVGAAVPANVALAEGLFERIFAPGRYAALLTERATADDVRAAAGEILAHPPEALASDVPQSPFCARLDAEGGAEVHVRLDRT